MQFPLRYSAPKLLLKNSRLEKKYKTKIDKKIVLFGVIFNWTVRYLAKVLSSNFAKKIAQSQSSLGKMIQI